MVRRFLVLFLAVSALLTMAPLNSPFLRGSVLASEAKECTVYVTRTGAKYHRATCSSLRYSRRVMTRSEALAAGYIACKRCGGSSCEVAASMVVYSGIDSQATRRGVAG